MMRLKLITVLLVIIMAVMLFPVDGFKDTYLSTEDIIVEGSTNLAPGTEVIIEIESPDISSAKTVTSIDKRTGMTIFGVVTGDGQDILFTKLPAFTTTVKENHTFRYVIKHEEYPLAPGRYMMKVNTQGVSDTHYFDVLIAVVEIRITTIITQPDQISIGETITLVVEAENVGNAPGIEDICIRIEPVEFEKCIKEAFDVGEHRAVVFGKIRPQSQGVYTVISGKEVTAFVVTSKTTPSPTPSPILTPKSSPTLTPDPITPAAPTPISTQTQTPAPKTRAPTPDYTIVHTSVPSPTAPPSPPPTSDSRTSMEPSTSWFNIVFFVIVLIVLAYIVVWIIRERRK